jgi:ribosomal protein S18 acetylase RimI-like enzyme
MAYYPVSAGKIEVAQQIYDGNSSSLLTQDLKGSAVTAEQDQLFNPVWTALTGKQKDFALSGSSLLRYQPDVLPFAAVMEPGAVVSIDRELDAGTMFFCDVLPELRGDHFTAACFRVVQMVYRGDPKEEPPHEHEVELTLADAEEMVELTSVAFPGFFRIHSVKLGRFVGIRQEGQLIAMAGERFRLPGLREISAVCTRPGYTGRGLAGHLMRRLLGGGSEWPFLHVSESNTHAIALYERLEFELVRTIDVLKVSRANS